MIHLTLILVSQLAATDANDPSTLERRELVRSRYIDAPRFRFGIGTWATGGRYPEYSGGLVGVSLHAGLQLNDRIAFYVLTQASTLLLWSALNIGVLAEYSVTDWFSVAMGAGTSSGIIAGRSGGGGFAGGPGGNGGYSTSEAVTLALGVPARVTFTIGPSHPESLRRHRFFIALDGFLGTQVAGREINAGPLSVSGGVSIGYQLM